MTSAIGRGEGSKICQNCCRIVLKNCRHGGAPSKFGTIANVYYGWSPKHARLNSDFNLLFHKEIEFSKVLDSIPLSVYKNAFMEASSILVLYLNALTSLIFDYFEI